VPKVIKIIFDLLNQINNMDFGIRVEIEKSVEEDINKLIAIIKRYVLIFSAVIIIIIIINVVIR